MAAGFTCRACGRYYSAQAVPAGGESRCPFCGQPVPVSQPQSQPPTHIFCAKCGVKNDENSYRCTACGFVLRGQQQYVVTSDEGLGGLIPYKNPHALWAYYLGLFSLVPCFGLLICIPAVVLGVMGLKKARQQPQAKGKVHAIIGIVLGGLCLLGYLLIGISLVVTAINADQKGI